jgi:hypothetical protein
MIIATPDSHLDLFDSGLTVTFYNDFIISTPASFGSSTGALALVSGTLPEGTNTVTPIPGSSYIDDSFQYTAPQTLFLTYGTINLDHPFSLTCSVGGTLLITYSITQFGAYILPGWITIDELSSYLIGTIPASDFYKFYIEASSSVWSTPIQKEITIVVGTQSWIWTIQNWIEWTDWFTGLVWNVCANGYLLEGNQCMEIAKEKATEMSFYARIGSWTIGLSIAVSAIAGSITSIFKVNSKTLMWCLINQIQMLIILLLVNNFVPFDVTDVITQQAFTLMDFGFFPSQDLPYINFPIKSFNFKQIKGLLIDLGLEWRSTLRNMYSFVVILFVVSIFHVLLALSVTCWANKTEGAGALKIFFIRNRAKLLFFLMYSFYARMFLEAHHSFLMSGIIEINEFVVDTQTAIASLWIAGVFVLFSLFLVLKAFYLLYRHWNNFDLNEDFFFMEYYADIRENKWARSYTSTLLTRRMAFIAIVLLCGFWNRNVIFMILLAIQLVYVVQLILIRPFIHLENNLIEVVNEIFYWVFVGLMLYLDGEEMWTDQMSTLFIGLIVGNNLITALIILSNLWYNF